MHWILKAADLQVFMLLVQYACSNTEGHCTDLNKKPYTVQDNGWKIIRNVAGELLQGTNNKKFIIYNVILKYYIVSSVISRI